MAKVKPEEELPPKTENEKDDKQQAVAETETIPIMTLNKVMDEESAQEEMARTPPEPESQDAKGIGKCKVARLKYDLACIIGGKIIAAVSWKDEKGMDTEKIGLVVEVESRQGPLEHFTIWPVQSLEDITAPVTHLEINKTELA